MIGEVDRSFLGVNVIGPSNLEKRFKGFRCETCTRKKIQRPGLHPNEAAALRFLEKSRLLGVKEGQVA